MAIHSIHCDKCDRAFSTRFNCNKHCKSVHGVSVPPVSYEKGVFNYKCLELNCNHSFKFNADLINHLQVQHNFNIFFEEKIFNNIDDFKLWKTDTENNENCSYVMPRGRRKKYSEGTEVKYYICNRSGKPRTKADSTNNRKRLTKSQGSSKLKYCCTSQIKLTIKEDSTVFMHRWKTHYGHHLELQHLRISDQDQHVIASKLISGVSTSRILDTTRDNIGIKLKRIDLLTRKDIDNVKRRFHVDIVDGIRPRAVENNFMDHAKLSLKNSSQEQLKNDFLGLHAKISLIDFNKLNPEVLRNINMQVRVIKNLLNTSLFEDQAKPVEVSLHSEENSEVVCKKSVKTESLDIKDLYISHDDRYDHLYTAFKEEVQ